MRRNVSLVSKPIEGQASQMRVSYVGRRLPPDARRGAQCEAYVQCRVHPLDKHAAVLLVVARWGRRRGAGPGERGYTNEIEWVNAVGALGGLSVFFVCMRLRLYFWTLLNPAEHRSSAPRPTCGRGYWHRNRKLDVRSTRQEAGFCWIIHNKGQSSGKWEIPLCDIDRRDILLHHSHATSIQYRIRLYSTFSRVACACAVTNLLTVWLCLLYGKARAEMNSLTS